MSKDREPTPDENKRRLVEARAEEGSGMDGRARRKKARAKGKKR